MYAANCVIESYCHAVVDAFLTLRPTQKAPTGQHDRMNGFGHRDLLRLQVLCHRACLIGI